MADEPESSASLDDVIVALQKAFSRVSARSAELPPEAARALVVGKVSFDLGLKTNILSDRLMVHPEGPIELKLSGTINQDIREVATPPTTDEGTATSEPDPGAAPPDAASTVEQRIESLRKQRKPAKILKRKT